MKEILGIVAVGIVIAQTTTYVIDIFRGVTKPHLYTYLVWAIVTVLVFFGQYVAGGGPGSWTTGMSGLLTVGVFLLCFRYGTKDVTILDRIFLTGALIAIIPWFLTDDPLYSVLLATLVDMLAFVPTIRKTYNDPTSETLISYMLNFVRHPMSIFALSALSLTTVIYPTAMLVMNAILVGVIILGRRKLSAGK